MEWPALLPERLNFLRRIRGEEQLLPILIETSDEIFTRFVEVASDDETWTESHLELMKSLFQWATEEFRGRRLLFAHVQRLVQCVHQHSEQLRSLLPADMEIKVKDYTSKGNSMLYAALSPTFREMVQASLAKPKSTLIFMFPDIPSDVFRIVEEYVWTGDVENLWRHPESMLMRVLMRAGQWRIRGLVKLTADVIKRYITRENVVNMIHMAQTYVLPALKDACCEVLNEMTLGAEFASSGEADLIVKIDEFRERNIELLNELAPTISTLTLKGTTAESLEIKQFLPRCVRLNILDMRGSEGCNAEILDLIPQIRELDLTNCPWLSDEHAKVILQHVHHLRILSLAENSLLGYECFHHVGNLKQLEILNCKYCLRLQDSFVQLIARGCPGLVSLNISWCPNISNACLESLGILGRELKRLDISHCELVTDAGLRDFVRNAHKLDTLVMQYCPLVTEEGIYNVVSLSPFLRRLDIRLCHVSEAGLAKIRKRSPNLRVIF